MGPGEVARAHRDRADGPSGVTDVREPAVHDGRKLDQMAETATPDEPERRTEPDVRGRLRARFVGAVERPLQVRLVDVDRLPAAVPEVDALPDRCITARRDGDRVLTPRRHYGRGAVT